MLVLFGGIFGKTEGTWEKVRSPYPYVLSTAALPRSARSRPPYVSHAEDGGYAINLSGAAVPPH